MATIVITGNEGYIGSRLELTLLSLGHKVIGIDKKSGNNIIWCQLPKEGVDVVYHLAAQTGAIPSMRDPVGDAKQNIMTTLRLIKEYPDKRIIFTTSGAAKKPESPYGVSKRACEDYLRILQKDYVTLRLSSIYGGKDRGIVDNFVRAKEVTVYGDGSAERDFVHVDDIVKALVEAKFWEPGTYECGSGIGTKVQEIAEATGKKINYEPAREGEIKRAVLENTTPSWKPTVEVLDWVRARS
jgi:UDP-glucose 4-epimerase